ncbi:MAG: thioredoxin domain-containing protein, partial [Acidobacteriota bacterium]
MPNRLAGETSPYLQQHAANPVDWYPWGDEALERARRENKPILLSIGYSACHWCHVMAHESFEDERIAALMNAEFVNIKVDREERPDLDQIYQAAQAMLNRRSGGWPLTMFLTPDQAPFFGGTYFPKESRYGLIGFPDLLQRVAEAYREQGGAIAEQNERLKSALALTNPDPPEAGAVLPARAA